MKILAIIPALSMSCAVPLAAAGARDAPAPRTAAAVQAADDAWGDAEARGDAAFVDWLLLPGYQSIGPAGKATSKAAIVAGTKAGNADPAARAAKIAAWKAAHPTRGDVAVYGDTAVLTWMSTAPATLGRVASCDIFVYRDGQWHAIYSQHADLG